MKVSIVIPNYNGLELLKTNLPIVLKAKEDSKNNIEEVIIVDDKSSDQSVDFLVKNFAGKIRLIKHKENRGFAAAVNTGIRSAKGEFVALINTDVVPEENFLEKVLPHFKNETVFGVSLHEKGYGWAKGTFKDGFLAHSPGGEGREFHDTLWISGGSGVFRRSLWMELNGMDEKIFSPFYWEDLDLSYRAAKRGYRLLWEPEARVVHEHETTMRTLNQKYVGKIKERNQLLFVWKNLTSPRLFRKHLGGLIKRIVRSPGYLIIFLMALKKLPFVLKARRKEKRESKVSDEAILAKFNA